MGLYLFGIEFFPIPCITRVSSLLSSVALLAVLPLYISLGVHLAGIVSVLLSHSSGSLPSWDRVLSLCSTGWLAYAAVCLVTLLAALPFLISLGLHPAGN